MTLTEAAERLHVAFGGVHVNVSVEVIRSSHGQYTPSFRAIIVPDSGEPFLHSGPSLERVVEDALRRLDTVTPTDPDAATAELTEPQPAGTPA